MNRRTLAFLMTCFIIFTSLWPVQAFADGLDTWTVRHPKLTGATLTNVAYGNDIYVAVGSSGTILTSSDSETWTSQNAGTGGYFTSVFFVNGKFHVFANDSMGQSIRLLTSTDGTNWEVHQTTGLNTMFGGVGFIYGNSTFVAISSAVMGTTFWSSPDGITWTQRHSIGGGMISYSISSIDYGNNRFIAAGSNNLVMSSPNGITWSTHSMGTFPDLGPWVKQVVFGNNTYVRINYDGKIYTSTDLVTWNDENITLPQEIGRISYLNDQFIGLGQNGTIWTSSDGKQWTSHDTNTTNVLVNVTYADNTFVAVGAGGTILTSDNGSDWTVRNANNTANLFNISYNGSTYAAVGANGAIVTSEDGVNWKRQNSPVTESITGITYANGTFAAVGGMGTIVTSEDGSTWTSQNAGTTENLQDIIFAKNRFVAIGATGAFLTSTDGRDWTLTSMPVEGLDYPGHIAYGNGTYVAVCFNNATIFTSTDGENFQRQSQDLSGKTISDVAFANNKFVAVGGKGSDGMIWSSSDGITWTEQIVNSFHSMIDISYENGMFAVIESPPFGSDSAYKLHTSTDGVNWTERYSNLIPFYRTQFLNNRLMAVGQYGLIVESGPLGKPKYTVTYDGNGNTGGSVPVDRNQYEENTLVSILGNTGSLTKTGFTFAGWNTQADGNGITYRAGSVYTMGAAPLTLYAKWTKGTVPPAYYPVTGVSLAPGSLTLLTTDAPKQLQATVEPSYATIQQVNWTSSNPEVATVDQNGLVTPLKAGETTITVTTVDGGKTASSLVTVKDEVVKKELDHLTASERNLWMQPNDTREIRVYAVYTDGSTADITEDDETIYKSSSKSKLDVSMGIVKSESYTGATVITVTYQDQRLRIPVTISKTEVEKLTFAEDNVDMKLDESVQLQVTATLSDGKTKEVTDLATWSTDDTDVIALDENGKVTARSAGTATIMVVYGGQEAELTVTVFDDTQLKKVIVSKRKLTLAQGDEQELTLTAVYADGSERDITKKAEWTSRNEKLVTVEDGTVTAVAPGRTSLKVKYSNKTIYISVTVTK